MQERAVEEGGHVAIVEDAVLEGPDVLLLHHCLWRCLWHTEERANSILQAGGWVFGQLFITDQGAAAAERSMAEDGCIELACFVGKGAELHGIDMNAGQFSLLAVEQDPLAGEQCGFAREKLLGQRLAIKHEIAGVGKCGVERVNRQAAIGELIEHQLAAAERCLQAVQRTLDVCEGRFGVHLTRGDAEAAVRAEQFRVASDTRELLEIIDEQIAPGAGRR